MQDPTANDDRRPPFEVIRPARQTVPLVFNSPHSGSDYPADFVAATPLGAHAIRQSEDIFVDRLFESAVGAGAPLLKANFPRAWLDVNREPFELDPKMFNETLPGFANTRSPRVASGLGTIPRLVGDGKAIYSRRLPLAEGLERIHQVYMPYHRALTELLDQTMKSFGFVILIDCHSMPSAAGTTQLRGRADFVLGDRHGSSCSASLTDFVESELVRLGYDVSRNRPYAGGFITAKYGRPAEGLHALQIEINRSLYLDERRLEPAAGYPRLAANVADLVSAISEWSADRATTSADAAE